MIMASTHVINMPRSAGLFGKVVAHPRLLALALGGLAACGFQPLGLWPIALAAMAGFAALVASAEKPGRAAWLGWLFGLSHFTFGNNWIATAFTHQAEMPPVLGWVAVPLLAVYLALYPALAALGARALGGRGLTFAFGLAFAGCWTVSELLRATVFTGYAWNPFSVVLLGSLDRPGLAALAPWFGTYALSGVAVLVAVGLALTMGGRRWLALGGGCLLLVIGMMLPAGEGEEGTRPFTLVQPNLPQQRLNDSLFYEANFVQLARLSAAREPGRQRLVLWPESGLADYLRPGYPQRYYDRMTAMGDPDFARRRIAGVIGAQSLLLTGAVDLEIQDGRAVGAYNAVTVLDGDGEIVNGYIKSHLVPYGEYLPLRAVLEPLGLSRLVAGTLDFLSGPGPRTIDLGSHGRAGVQICYEIVFSGEVIERGNRPDFIFNPSNDGWFGAFGPPQHLAQARMRAIEEGLPVLRSTTTGISAVIDARGVVREHLPLNVAGRIDGTIPPAHQPTLFARLGALLCLAWAIAFLGAAHVAWQRQRH
jgi:apolipoprotein N-acyltransferase